jgi:hypothetical protein
MISVYIASGFSKQYQVGIITPYNAQSRLILAMLRDLGEQEKEGKEKATKAKKIIVIKQ